MPVLGSTDIVENDKELVFTSDMPGLKAEDVKVRVLEDNVLHISGERKSEKREDTDKCHRIERSFGAFERHFRLPKNVDPTNISAKVEGGVLTVRVPRCEPKPAVHDVTVQ